MRLLLDTHALLWWLSDDPKLRAKARELISDPANDILISIASLWEIQVKVRIGKLVADLQAILDETRNQGFELLDITPIHLMTLGPMARHHRDPWDHLLIAQATTERAIFMSDDVHVPLYTDAYVTCSGSRTTGKGAGVSTLEPSPQGKRRPRPGD